MDDKAFIRVLLERIHTLENENAKLQRHKRKPTKQRKRKRQKYLPIIEEHKVKKRRRAEKSDFSELDSDTNHAKRNVDISDSELTTDVDSGDEQEPVSTDTNRNIRDVRGRGSGGCHARVLHGRREGKYCQVPAGSNRYCYNHRIAMGLPEKPERVEKRCRARVREGKRKGEICGKRVTTKNGESQDYCGSHLKTVICVF